MEAAASQRGASVGSSGGMAPLRENYSTPPDPAQQVPQAAKGSAGTIPPQGGATVEPTSDTIPWSESVKAAIEALDGHSPVDSWAIVRELFKLHHEYGNKGAGALIDESGSTTGPRRRPNTWLRQAWELVDPSKTEILHGRLFILLLARIDGHLRGFLESKGILAALTAELRPPLESVLQPYSAAFLRILHNEGKYQFNTDECAARKAGFVLFVRGPRDLGEFQNLCMEQTYNRCLTARYKIPASDVPGALLSMFLTELSEVAAGTRPAPDKWLPDTEDPKWRWWMNHGRSHKFDAHGAGPTALGNLLPEMLRPLSSDSLLPRGDRLVLFGEIQGATDNQDLESLGLDDATLTTLEKQLPERMGLVLSGLPRKAAVPSIGPYVEEIYVPLRPARGQALENDAPQGEDQLQIQAEVEALADTIALKAVTPPLVVGVLGGWGTGKSFVMHLLEQRLHQIRCAYDLRTGGNGAKEGEEFPFIGHPYIIRFDAWTYAKTDLWASLMHSSFTELNRQIDLEHRLQDQLEIDPLKPDQRWRLLFPMSDRQRETFLDSEAGREALAKVKDAPAGSTQESELWKSLSKQREKQRAALKEAETELAKNRVALEEKRKELEEAVDREITRDARRLAWMPLRKELEKLLGNGLKSAVNQPLTQAEVEDALGLGSYLRRMFTWGNLPFLAVLLAGWGYAHLHQSDLDRAAIGTASSLIAVLTPWIRAGVTLKKRIDDRYKVYEAGVLVQQQQLQAQRPERLSKTRAEFEAKGDDSLRSMEATVQQQEHEVENLRREVGMTAQHESLVQFLVRQAADNYYQQRLGIIHRVRCDFEELTEGLLSPDLQAGQEGKNGKPLFPRGAPRIFLFIDDLDRCPPARVVEVLEAVQLLVKTRLFVVVLAMDVRYVTRALEKAYEGILERKGAPSGLDYIEKIVQIPYRVRPIHPDAMDNYLGVQMKVAKEAALPETNTEEEGAAIDEGGEGAGREPTRGGDESPDPRGARHAKRAIAPPTPPAKVLSFDGDELAMLTACCNAVGVTPRSAKRLVNVFKLLKIVWFGRGLEDGPPVDVRRAVLLLLALSARYPAALRFLLEELAHGITSAGPKSSVTLTHYLQQQCSQARSKVAYAADWTRLSEIINDSTLLSPTLTLGEFDLANLHLVSSFSFTGELDALREESPVTELRNTSQPAAITLAPVPPNNGSAQSCGQPTQPDLAAQENAAAGVKV